LTVELHIYQFRSIKFGLVDLPFSSRFCRDVFLRRLSSRTKLVKNNINRIPSTPIEIPSINWKCFLLPLCSWGLLSKLEEK